jgi:hypothetical protein
MDIGSLADYALLQKIPIPRNISQKILRCILSDFKAGGENARFFAIRRLIGNLSVTFAKSTVTTWRFKWYSDALSANGGADSLVAD